MIDSIQDYRKRTLIVHANKFIKYLLELDINNLFYKKILAKY